jgi:hypothetical protein
LAFPGLIRGIVSIYALMFVLLLLQPKAMKVFIFDWERIQAGEYWRTVSFLAIPPIGPGAYPVMGAVFMFIAMMIGFLVNDSLERAWGVFRTSLYVYGTLACIVLATFLFQDRLFVHLSGGALVCQAMFFPFATIFPRHEFRLFYILPLQAWILAAIAGIVLLLDAFSNVHYGLYIGLCFLPYLIWALPRILPWSKRRGQIAVRKAAFKSKLKPASATFHRCEACGATDASHPDRDFRVTEDHRELCDSCLDPEPAAAEPDGKPS